MSIQLLNKSFSKPSKIKNILLTYYSACALKYPKYNKGYIKKTVEKMLACRTEASGCRIYKCPVHAVFRIVPHSCGSRFCTVCSSFKTMLWVREKVVLLSSINTPYCFLTVTAPGGISRLIQENKELLLSKVFHAVSGSLLGWCQRRRNFTPGIVMIMQTSGDKLNYHVHIHLLITCGGLKEEKEWLSLTPGKREKSSNNGKKFNPAFPPKAILAAYKALLYRALRKAYQTDGFIIPNEYQDSAADFAGFNKLLDAWWKINWNIDISDPLRSTKEILEYIARYIKKPPISNCRIVSYDDNVVKFTAKDRQSKDKKRKEIVIMNTEDFVMRFLEHVPLEHFPLVRWYGIFSNKKKKKLMPIAQKLIPPSQLTSAEDSREAAIAAWQEMCQKKLGIPSAKEKAVDLWRKLHKEHYGVDPLVCPICGRELQLVAGFCPRQLTSMGLSFEDIPQFLMN